MTQAPVEPPQRRHVTVLFTDLSDSTRLSGAMEPEIYAAMLGEVRQRFRAAIESHGGVINQYQGDGLQALFGYPKPSEHDGRHATEAALEVHRQVRALQPQYVAQGAAGLSVHSGIHAGSVLARRGDDVAGRVELFGPGPGIAKHLSDEAAGDEILVSEETLGPGSLFFETSERRLVMLKGRADALPIHRILARTALRTRFEAHAQRGLVPFIGRNRELGRLQRALDSVIGGRPAFIALRAPAGVGKTRLADEFLRHAAAARCAVWRGYCESDLSAEPLQPFLQMLRSRLRLPAAAAASPQAVADAAAQGGPELLALLPQLQQLLCAAATEAAEPPRRRGAARAGAAGGLRGLIAALAGSAPQVLFIDDWQWADDATRRVCFRLRELTQLPILLLVATRPGDAGAATLGDAEVIEPEPFSDLEADATIGELLPVADPFVAGEIRRYAGGNPLFIEELCHFAARAGWGPGAQAMRGGSAWLETLIESRVAQLPPAGIELLSAAAVIGNVIPGWLLERLTGCGEDDPRVRDLAANDFLFPCEDGASLRFKHGITRDVVYGNVGLGRRIEMHASIARLIHDRAQPDGEGDACEALAYHHAGAADHEAAARYAEMAGDKAMAASSIDRAKAQYRAALEMLERLPATPPRYQRWRSIVRRLGMASVFDPARGEIHLFERAVERARGEHDAAGLAYAQYWLAYIQYSLGDMRPAIRHCQGALDAAVPLGDALLATQARATLGQALAAAGDNAKALPLLDAASDEQRAASAAGRPSPGVAYTLACKASVLADLGRFDAAGTCFAEALAALPSAGHEVEGSVLCLRAAAKLWQGRWEDARADAASAQRVGERVRSFYLLAMSRALGAWASWRLDGDAQSLRVLADSTAWLEGRDKLLYISLNHGWLAEALVGCDRVADARRHAARAFARARQGDRLGLPAAARAMAQLAARAGDAPRMRRYLALAHHVAEARNSAHEAACNALCEAEVELACGSLALARAGLERAEPAFVALQMHWHLAKLARLGRDAA